MALVENHWVKDAVNDLAYAITIAADYRIIKGYEDGSFRPNGKITREEAMIIRNLLKIKIQ
ncbi:S-layer homology domain-containing protein [Wukongibacter sp. M2B1]|uniref:S-layer homology domain-containing protein n=1 Tax=Wukongibacter sp. M2B1 TaxID=3088895 RepID=UPI003D7A6EF9